MQEVGRCQEAPTWINWSETVMVEGL